MAEFNREKIEAAVRAFGKAPSQATGAALYEALDAPGLGWWLPRGSSNADAGVSSLSSAGAWLAHVRALDAKAAPAADPLEGVVFISPADVLRTAENWGSTEGGRGLVEHDWVVFRSGHTLASIAAHARAQLARESAPAQPPALTLEQARAMCRGAGDTVVEAPPRPNYVKPAEMLAWFEASVAVRKADKHMGDAASRCAMQDRDAWTETPDDCTVESEIGRLRALGVTPAVLK